MKRVILYTNEEELARLEEFKNKPVNKEGLSESISVCFTNDKTKLRYYPIKVVLNCYDTRSE